MDVNVGGRWALVAVALVILFMLPLLIVGERLDEWTNGVLHPSARPGHVVVLVVTLLALDTVLPVPSSILATVAGHRLGFVGASAAILVGLCLGNLVGYLIGRMAGTRAIEAFVGREQLERARRLATTRPGAMVLAATRPVPIFSEATIVLAGMARTPIVVTAVVCALANAGVAMAYAGMGSAAHGAAALPFAIAGSIGLPALALAGVVLVERRRVRSP